MHLGGVFAGFAVIAKGSLCKSMVRRCNGWHGCFETFLHFAVWYLISEYDFKGSIS
jgi:hypothetical protein